MADESDPLAIAEYRPMSSVALTDAERWPAQSRADRARLDAVLGHPLAPAWVHRTGHRLRPAEAERARDPLPTAGWLAEHLAVVRALPAYRGHPSPLVRLEDFPLVSRDDLAADMAAFVPLGADLGRMVAGTSSGVTGNPLVIPDDIDDVARTFWLLVRLLADQGVQWRPDPQRLALAYIVQQRQVFTYASSIPGFGGGVMARLNLGDSGWTGRNGFLASHDPQVYSGSPASLAALLEPELRPQLHPLALISGAVHLSAALRAELQRAFGCPVLDIYGLHETRPIAVSADGGPFVVLDRRVLVECLAPDGSAVAAGQRGEIVVTAGENPLLPLARYRTGDFGRLVEVDGRPAIADLEGREDVEFLSAAGTPVPSVDLTQQLQAAGARGWTVVQRADGALDVVIARGDADSVRRQLGLLFDTVRVQRVEQLAELGEGKPRRYRREQDVGGFRRIG